MAVAASVAVQVVVAVVAIARVVVAVQAVVAVVVGLGAAAGTAANPQVPGSSLGRVANPKSTDLFSAFSFLDRLLFTIAPMSDFSAFLTHVYCTADAIKCLEVRGNAS